MGDLELRGECFDDARDLVRDALKRANDWKSFYGVASVAESYARRDTEIHLHLIFRSHRWRITTEVEEMKNTRWWWLNMPDLCIRFQRHPELEYRPTSDNSFEPIAPCNGGKNWNEAMLVNSVQLVKKKKRAFPTPIPSLVWLKRLDACPKPPLDTFEASPATCFPPEMGDGLTIMVPSLCTTNEEYRKSGARRGGGLGQASELPSEAVECGAEVMGYLSDQDVPLDGEGERPILDTEIVVSGLSIELGFDNTIGVFFEKPLSVIMQSYELALCPLDFSPWPIQRVHEADFIAQSSASQSETNSNG